MPDLLSPLTHVLAGALATGHHLVTSLGISGGFAWATALALLVVALRVAILPLAVRSFRHTVAMRAAAPELRRLQERFSGRNDAESLRAHTEQRRALLARHGVSGLGLGLGPMLLQLPLLWSMYHLVTTLAAGRPLGLLDAGLVASASGASLLGVHLSTKLLAAPVMTTWPLLLLALVAAAGSYAAARWGAVAPPEGLMAWLPAVSAVGVLVTTCFVPAGVVLYWALTNTWTAVERIALRRAMAA